VIGYWSAQDGTDRLSRVRGPQRVERYVPALVLQG
jgi:hypothetical protein